MSLTQDEQYQQIVSTLRVAHGELLRMEGNGFDQAVRENPALIGEYLIKLRLNCNLLFSFQNKFLELLSTAQRGTAEKRQGLYEAQLALGKSPNSSKDHAENMTRVDGANVKVLENKIQSIKNEYSRYDGICMALQSRMREYNAERMMN